MEAARSSAPESFQKFKWTLIVTFLGVGISILASYVGTGAFDPVRLLIGLVISITVSLVTSRYEEFKINTEMMNRTIGNLLSISDNLGNLISPVKVVPATRTGMYSEAIATMSYLLKKHESNNQVVPGWLLIVQRTPSSIFHSELQAQVPGYVEERNFKELLDKATELAKEGKIRMIFAFSISDPVFRDRFRHLLRNDPKAADRVRSFVSSFYNEEDPHRFWNSLRLYPMENRKAHPFIVADDIIGVWVEETEEDRTYMRAVDERVARVFFEKYWALSEAVPPTKAQQLLMTLK